MEHFFEQIESYKNNTLNVSEKLAFEKEMGSNVSLKMAVENYELLKEINLGGIDLEVRDIAAKVEKTRKIRRRLFWFISASIVLIIGFITYYLYVKNRQPVLQYADLYIDPAWPIQRGGEIDTLSQAMIIGLSGDVEAAKKMIKVTSLPEFEKNLWIAELYAKNGSADSVLVYLPDRFINSNQRDRIYFLKVISLQKLGKTDSLQKVINAMPEKINQEYKNRLKEILLN